MHPLARNATTRDNEPRLPSELVDQVLRNFHYFEDRGTLCNCGLVSRTWLALSRAVLFYFIFITPFSITANYKKLLATFESPTVRSHVREIALCVHPTAKWTEKDLPKLLAQFPACKTLRLEGNWKLLRQLHVTNELEFFIAPPSRNSNILTVLRRLFTFPRTARRKSTMALGSNNAEDPTVMQVPLAQVRTVHLSLPRLNAPVLALLAPPALDTLHLILNDSDPEAIHAALCAAGDGLRALVLRFRTNLLLDRPATPLPTQLRVLHLQAPLPCPALMAIAAHLLECVLAVPSLEELVIKPQEFDMDGGRDIGMTMSRDATRARLERLLQTLPALKTVRIPA
ncbi:hypothetical protein B0H13DRAFT_2343352 [Mycena leptocephala]|nr:hypothetical protein B0H13DRAFT_2343352 [Mycena leptocephala]